MALDLDLRYDGLADVVVEAALELDGRIVAVCGPSGSGKTTLLLLLAGLLEPSSGRIAIDGDVVVDVARGLWTPPWERGVALMAQESLLFAHRSVRANLEYGAKRRGRATSFERVVASLELEALLDRRPGTLSGGQARRVALGRALLSRPRVLLLDEPTTGLEHSLKRQTLQLVHDLSAEWACQIVLVSHDPADVAQLAAQVVTMEQGAAGLEREAQSAVAVTTSTPP